MTAVSSFHGSRHLEYPPLGALPGVSGGTSFRVWAPRASEVRLHILEPCNRVENLQKEEMGYHHVELDDISEGALYRFVLPDGAEYPDPASRSQPEGVHGPSAVFDSHGFEWSDNGFGPETWWRSVIYELHVGTFTAEGTLDAAIPGLDHLVDLGVSSVELMPLAQFPGGRNWGYDGVFPFAVQNTYGGPKALQRFANACHERGLSLFLDVVYNHLGPEGNVLPRYGAYFTDRYRTPWGEAVNVDGPDSDEVRRYLVANALWWFTEFHVDGLRLDAVHEIIDTTARPFLLELSEATEALSGRLERPLRLVAESADNNPRVVMPPSWGGIGLDAQWDDDFHHALHSVLTGENTGYYADFGRLEDVAFSLSNGFVLEGQYSKHRQRRHGAPSGDLDPERLVVFDQNHDQVGNRPTGDRLSSRLDASRLRLAAAVLLLSPYVLLLFMGEEYAEDAPFPFFVDHSDPELLEAVRRGRAAEMRQIGLEAESLDPTDPVTFEMARINVELRNIGDHARVWATYRGLLELRRTHPALGRASRHGNFADVPISGVLRVVRRADGGNEAEGDNKGEGGRDGESGREMIAFFNFRAEPVQVAFPQDSETGWNKFADSASAELGGSGPTLPDEVAGGAVLTLDAAAFCAYGS